MTRNKCPITALTFKGRSTVSTSLGRGHVNR